MQIGIMGGTVRRDSLSETLDAVVNYGIHCMQFSLGGVGLRELPEQLDTELCDSVRTEFEARNIDMAGIDGTYNMIHPDVQRRHAGLRKLRVVASACDRLGTSVIVLCTGTRNPDSMWRHHPDNETPSAWTDLVASMRDSQSRRLTKI